MTKDDRIRYEEWLIGRNSLRGTIRERIFYLERQLDHLGWDDTEPLQYEMHKEWDFLTGVYKAVYSEQIPDELGGMDNEHDNR